MRIFLDTSVMLAASGSVSGASRAVIRLASDHGWTLISSIYCRDEAERNIIKLGKGAAASFRADVLPFIEFAVTRVGSGSALVYSVTKDRPVVITALAERCDALLTLDRADFHEKLGGQVYGMSIRTPGDWLSENLGGEQ